MAVEGLYAQVLIEAAGFMQTPGPQGPEPEGAPTLDAALRQAGAVDADADANREPPIRNDALIPDLWLTRLGHAVESPHVGPFESVTVLRPLSDDEYALITGSDASVMGPGWDWNFPINDPGDQYPTGSGGGSGEPSPPEPLPTPCVEASPEGVDLIEMNRAALAASNAIAALNDENIEYSSIIWSLNGTVGWTTPYTGGFDTDVNLLGGIAQVPTGAVIVGIVHNHPDGDADDRIPSGAGQENGKDWTAYDQIINWNRDHSSDHDLPRGITVDRSMLFYIYTDQDHKTHVYDKTDKNQTFASCSLQ
jgi:hypothetical protein